MCAMSMIGDFYSDKYKHKPYIQPWPSVSPSTPLTPILTIPVAELEQLKRDVADMKELLRRAKKYDQDNKEPACEIEEKVALLRALAKPVGVDLSDVLAPKPASASPLGSAAPFNLVQSNPGASPGLQMGVGGALTPPAGA